MEGEWQSWAVYFVVGATILIFAWQLLRRKKPGAGCGGCGCAESHGIKRHKVIEDYLKQNK